jgi:hypothetical protein
MKSGKNVLGKIAFVELTPHLHPALNWLGKHLYKIALHLHFLAFEQVPSSYI